MKKVTKAVIPAAGLGTRLLPATKALPKEMLTIVDKPSLQYIVEELVASGITDIVIITGRNKNSIEDHFDFSYELENTLKNDHKSELLNKVSHISNMANIYYVRQNMPLGLGHAILKAKSFIGDEPFVIALGDDIIYNPEKPVIKQMIEKYELYGKSIIGCQEVAKEDLSKYGIVKLGDKLDEATYQMLDFLEKPSINDAPSRILAMMKDDEEVLAYNFIGKRYDIGSKFGLLKANIEFGLRNKETKEDIKEYLKKLNIEKI